MLDVRCDVRAANAKMLIGSSNLFCIVRKAINEQFYLYKMPIPHSRVYT